MVEAASLESASTKTSSCGEKEPNVTAAAAGVSPDDRMTEGRTLSVVRIKCSSCKYILCQQFPYVIIVCPRRATVNYDVKGNFNMNAGK